MLVERKRQVPCVVDWFEVTAGFVVAENNSFEYLGGLGFVVFGLSSELELSCAKMSTGAFDALFLDLLYILPCNKGTFYIAQNSI